MIKIHSFAIFSDLYEADAASAIGGLLVKPTESSKLYDQTLGLILTTAINSYSSELTFPVKPYEDIKLDMTSVKSAPVEDKPKAFFKIIMKVKQDSAENTTKGASDAIDAWVAAGTKAGDALGAMIDQYKDKPEELKYINDFVNAKIDSYIKSVEDATETNVLKKQIGGLLAKNNESSSYERSEEIFEGILQGKKGMIEDVAKQITLATAKLASLAQTPGMTADVQKLQSEVNQIAAKMGDLLNKNNSEISKEDVKKAATRLAEIPTEADKIAEKLLKQDATNKEAAAILVQALSLVQDAKDKEIIYLQNKEGKETSGKSDQKGSVVEYNPEKSGEKDEKVRQFQQMVINRFKNINKIANLAEFKKMGSDGKFGPATAEMVKILKSGYNLENPSSSDITNELLAELRKDEVIGESRILSFNTYSRIFEAFDVEAAVKASSARKSSSVGGEKAKSTKSGSSKKLLYKKGDTGNVVIAINRIVGQTADEKNYTDDTVARVLQFQKLNNLYKDGIAGEDTLTGLYDTREAAPNQLKLNDPKAPRGETAYKILAELLKDIYKREETTGTLSNIQIQAIANNLIKATNGAGTSEGKVLKSMEELKGKRDFQILDNLIKKGNETRGNFSKLKEIGLKTMPVYKNIQDLINGEMGSDDIGSVKSIKVHLAKIGVDADYKTGKESGDFIEDSFRIK